MSYDFQPTDFTPSPFVDANPTYEHEFPDPPLTRKYQITDLSERHNEILEMHALGMKSVDIAKVLGVTPIMVNYTVNSELGRARIAEIRSLSVADTVDIAKRIQDALPDAIAFLHDTVRAEDVSVGLRIKASTELLDRGGFPRATRVEGKFMTAHLTHDDVEEIKREALERARARGSVV